MKEWEWGEVRWKDSWRSQYRRVRDLGSRLSAGEVCRHGESVDWSLVLPHLKKKGKYKSRETTRETESKREKKKEKERQRETEREREKERKKERKTERKKERKKKEEKRKKKKEKRKKKKERCNWLIDKKIRETMAVNCELDSNQLLYEQSRVRSRIRE